VSRQVINYEQPAQPLRWNYKQFLFALSVVVCFLALLLVIAFVLISAMPRFDS
jgi:hypothetical protein